MSRPNDDRENGQNGVVSAKDGFPRSDEITPHTIELLAQGDHAAFSSVFNAHAGPVTRLLTRILRSHEEAEEIAQEVFAGLWEKRSTLVSVKKLEAYLYTTAKYMAIRHIQNRRTHRNYIENEKFVIDILDISADEAIMTRQAEILLADTLERMPEQRSRVFKLHHDEGYSYDEIAIILQISNKTVYKHMGLAKADIKNAIDHYESDPDG